MKYFTKRVNLTLFFILFNKMENLAIYILTLALIAMLFAFPFMWLWNWIIPIFWTTAPVLTYWQAFGTYMLLNIIGSTFKSISK